ncbi:MAG: hypothetical protein RBU23_12490 [Candidatus Auribacterota bacterium]|jgi:hypothetical protein|nr:hypothetical protein [Candidatus Auribacterota bacterium]
MKCILSYFVLGLLFFQIVNNVFATGESASSHQSGVKGFLTVEEVEGVHRSLGELYEPVRKDLVGWVERQGEQAGVNIELGVDMKHLWQSYQSSNSFYSKWLAGFGRVWAYDAALGLYSVLAEKNYQRARLAVDNFMEVIRAEKKRGYRGLMHFSYNTRDDQFIDPREPQGATQWVLKALYTYMLETGDLRHFKELTGYVRNDILPLQIVEPEHPAFGLLRQGYMHPKGLAQGGYDIYSEIDELNVVSHGVNMEHNADYIDFLRLVALVIDKYADQLDYPDIEKFRDEVRVRHALCMQGAKRIRQGKYWPTAFAPNGEANWSKAVDHYSWLAHTFMGVKDDDDIPWDSIQILYNEFTTTIKAIHVLERRNEVVIPLSKPVKGIFFFTSDFMDSFVDMPGPDRFKLEEMVQPEATAGAIIMILDFTLKTADPHRREFALAYVKELLEGLAEIHRVYKQTAGYTGGGMPYSTEIIHDFFTPDPSSAAVITYQLAIKKLQTGYSNFLGVSLPEGFENALLEQIDLSALPEGLPVPEFVKTSDQDFSTESIPAEELAKLISIEKAEYRDGTVWVNISYPEDYTGQFELIVLKKTDYWYVQPASVSTIRAGCALPASGTDVPLCNIQGTTADSLMLVVARKNNPLKHNSFLARTELDKYFIDGIFIVGSFCDGKSYVK